MFAPLTPLPDTAPQQPLKVLIVFGTRPEAIKMAPVVLGLSKHPQHFDVRVCVTAQHRDMLDQVLSLFDITPHHDLDVMKPNQDLFQVTTAVLNGMKPILEAEQPDIVLVQGDTTTAMAVAMAAFYLKIPVGHIEAGLRTDDIYYPFPEEVNRIIADGIASLHFAPTEGSKENLLRYGANPSTITVTGNTVIDALFHTVNATKNSNDPLPVDIPDSMRMILATVHRRENFGTPLHEIARGLLDVIEGAPDTVLVLPVHPNPNVGEVLRQYLDNHPRIHLIPPQDYGPFCQLMAKSHLILTDSGGVQEEAPSLSKPVLVLRDETERPEAVSMGTVKLVGPHRDPIVKVSHQLLQNPQAYATMAQAVNPYGDGQATDRITMALMNWAADRSHGKPTPASV